MPSKLTNKVLLSLLSVMLWIPIVNAQIFKGNTVSSTQISKSGGRIIGRDHFFKLQYAGEPELTIDSVASSCSCVQVIKHSKRLTSGDYFTLSCRVRQSEAYRLLNVNLLVKLSNGTYLKLRLEETPVQTPVLLPPIIGIKPGNSGEINFTLIWINKPVKAKTPKFAVYEGKKYKLNLKGKSLSLINSRKKVERFNFTVKGLIVQKKYTVIDIADKNFDIIPTSSIKVLKLPSK